MKNIAITLAFALLLATAAHAEDAAVKKDYVVLKVDGKEIKKSEVEAMWKSIFPGGNAPAYDAVDEKVKENLLRGIASENVLQTQAEKSGVADSQDVKDHIEAARRQIIIQEFLKSKTKDLVSEAKLKQAYDAKVKNAGGGEEVHARHILVTSEEEAKDIEKKLKKGANFEKLAKEKSQDKASGSAGGDLGWFTADKMVPEFSQAAFALKKGEVSAPVKTDFGWHIIKVEDRRKATPASFEQMKESLRQEIGNQAVNEYVGGLMKDVKVVQIDAEGHEKDLPIMPVPADKK